MASSDTETPTDELAFDRARLSALIQRLDTLWPAMRAEIASSPAAKELKEAGLYVHLSARMSALDGLGSQFARSGHIRAEPGLVLSWLREGAPRLCEPIAARYAFAAEHLPTTREAIDTLDLVRLLLLEVVSAHPERCVPDADSSPPADGA